MCLKIWSTKVFYLCYVLKHEHNQLKRGKGQFVDKLTMLIFCYISLSNIYLIVINKFFKLIIVNNIVISTEYFLLLITI